LLEFTRTMSKCAPWSKSSHRQTRIMA